jgi:hypothetical protein
LRRTWLAAVAWAALSACSLLVDTDGLVDSAGVTDPTNDGGAADATGTPDGAGADARPPGDAGADASARVCDATFCDDFDTTSLGATWDQVTQSGGGTLSLGGGALSAPNALVVDLTGTARRIAFLGRSFATVTSSVECAVSLFVEIPPSTSVDARFLGFGASGPGEPVLYLKLEGSAGAGLVGLRYYSDVGLPDGGVTSFTDNVTTIPVGVWKRVRLWSDGTTSTVTVDGASSTFPVVAAGLEPISVLLGETGDGDKTPVRFRLDDLVCQVQ